MKGIAPLAVIASLALAVPGLRAAEATGGVTATEIPMSGAPGTVIGQPLSYPEGAPRLRAFRITIPPGGATALHSHEVPLFAYVVSGDLEVDYGSRGKRRFKAGDAFMEAINWCHAGRAVGAAAVVIVAAYLGAEPLRDNVACPAP